MLEPEDGWFEGMSSIGIKSPPARLDGRLLIRRSNMLLIDPHFFENHADTGRYRSIYIKWPKPQKEWKRVSLTLIGGNLKRNGSTEVQADGWRLIYL